MPSRKISGVASLFLDEVASSYGPHVSEQCMRELVAAERDSTIVESEIDRLHAILDQVVSRRQMALPEEEFESGLQAFNSDQE